MTSRVVPNHYIVVFKADTPREKCNAHCDWAHQRHASRVGAFSAAEAGRYAGVKHKYAFSGFQGYAGSFDDETKAEIEGAEEVDFIEADAKVYTCNAATQNSVPSWGLARISHQAKLTDDTKTTYTYDDSAGSGVRAYIIDTGVFAEHEDFGGRAKFAHNAVSGSTDTDLNGHGTHVSGTIGSATYGVAKKVSIFGVKVLGDDGSGTNSTVIAGLQWAADDANAAGAINKSVANMSLGGSTSTAVNRAVAAVVAQGMTVCVAAGNESADASTSSPASEPTAVTVGATTIDDAMADFSNYGKLVDIFAPGVDITSTWIDTTGGDSKSNTNTISGTSMATPHVTGLAAYLIAKENLSGSKAVTARLKELAGSGLLSGLTSDSPNLLAYNGAQSGSS